MQAILFDFFGVVARPRDVSTTIAKFVRKDLSEVKPLYELYEAGRVTCEEFWKQLGVKNYKATERKIADQYKTAPNFKDVHAELKKTYVTAVVSNSNSHLIRELLRRFSLVNSFEAVIVSQEVGVRKPDPVIYRKALGILGLNAEECVFVDDRLVNLETAKELGMTTVFNLVEPETHPYKPDYTIDTLPQLLGIMETVG